MSAKDKNLHRDNARTREEIVKGTTVLSELVGKPTMVIDRVLPALFPGESSAAIGRRSMYLLAKRMVSRFCSDVNVNAPTWVAISDRGLHDTRIMMRRSTNDPGCPTGIVLKCSASFWVPLPPRRVFNFLNDLRFRTVWDVLSTGSLVDEIFHITTGQEPCNRMSVLRIVGGENSMVVQETWIGPRGFFLVFAPVDPTTTEMLLTGSRNPDNVDILPSGFSIMPDGPTSSDGRCLVEARGFGGSSVTVTFQNLATTDPSAEVSSQTVSQSVGIACSLLAHIVDQLKADLGTRSASL